MYYDGKKIFNEIARREQSVTEFANEAGISRLAVYRAIDSGRVNTRTLGKIARALEIQSPNDLLKTKTGAQASM